MIEHQVIDTKHCGKLNVYIEGNRCNNETIIMTVHDLGCNHNQFLDFLSHPDMASINSRTVWVHIDLPGQSDGDEELPADFRFPTMEEIGDDLFTVATTLDLKQVVLLGEGAGANICARFAIAHSERVLGVILIHCTGTTAGLIESMKDRAVNFKLGVVGMNPAAESFLVVHRFGSLSGAVTEQDLRNIVNNFKESLRTQINSKNLIGYITAFMNRSNIADKIGDMKVPSLFMTGSLASHNKPVHLLYTTMQKAFKDDNVMRSKIELVVVDDVANVISEKPRKVADCLLFFLQGLGLMGGIVHRRMSNTVASFRQRSMSMEEYDKPKGVANCVYDANKGYEGDIKE